jgi:hypothetical protein
VKPVSLTVPTFDEGPAVQRLLASSVHAAHLIREWVVLDHRSSDDTQARLDAVEPLLNEHGMRLRRLFEARDFSPTFLMADLRNAALRACAAPIVVMLDADFILGAAFTTTLENAVEAIEAGETSVSFPVPVVWDHLTVDDDGRVASHGRVWVHHPARRIMCADAVQYRQAGKWEVLRTFTGKHPPHRTVPNDGSVALSVNVKPRARIDLRSTMTPFLEDAKRGRVATEWLAAYRSGNVRRMPPYAFQNVDLRGVTLNLTGLELRA